MLNDPRMHRASISANVSRPRQTRHDLNTPPPPRGMEGTRNSISSNLELGIQSMFATYVETPSTAQPWLRTYPQSPDFFEGLHQPKKDSVYYVHNPYVEASSFNSSNKTIFTYYTRALHNFQTKEPQP